MPTSLFDRISIVMRKRAPISGSPRWIKNTLFLSCLSLSWAPLWSPCAEAAKTKADLVQVVSASPRLPSPTKTCPSLNDPLVEFHPQGLERARRVKIWQNPAAQPRGGALYLFWHGTLEGPEQVKQALGPEFKRLLDRGDTIVAPFSDPNSGVFPWFSVSRKRDDDLRLADEIVACVARQRGINPRRIHVLGMSAGGVQATEMGYRRAEYVASVASFSGGLIRTLPPNVEARRFAPAMLVHGGRRDNVLVDFEKASKYTAQQLRKHQSQAILCDHGKGHRLPKDLGPSVAHFFAEHPYGQKPPRSPSLAAVYPEYCRAIDRSSEPTTNAPVLGRWLHWVNELGSVDTAPPAPRKRVGRAKRWRTSNIFSRANKAITGAQRSTMNFSSRLRRRWSSARKTIDRWDWFGDR